MELDNPFFHDYETPLATPPFDLIEKCHYMPAIRRGIANGLAEVKKITDNPDEPTFENTVVALEKCGCDLDRVLNVFGPLLSADSDNEMMEISLEANPLLTDYSTAIALNKELWERVKHVYDHRDDFELTGEDKRLLKETYESFARSGALLDDEGKDQLRKITTRMGELTTLFGQNVLKELNTYEIYLERDDLAGLTETMIEEAAAAAAAKGREGSYLFTLAQPTYIGFMKHSSRRDLRERMYRLYSGRNISGEFSNMEIIKEISFLRYRMARLLGRKTFAHFALEHKMAGSPEAVFALLDKLRDAYRPALHVEIDNLSAYARSLDPDLEELKPWDYSYYSNKLKEAEYSYDEEAMRPYFKLENVIDGVFGLATRLYGVTFVERTDIPVYHPDVKAFEVKDADGSYLGVLFTDFFPRETKRPGAWMTEFKGQWHEADGTDSRPHISLVMNFTKPTATKPSLLTPYEVSTFLHEFGHALHGLLSKVTYESLSGTNVRRDFVELPSQFNENYLTQKEFLDSFARHYVTGEAIPSELVDAIVKSSQFGAAYACMRQLNFGYLDMAWHMITEPVADAAAFEIAAGASVAIFEPVENALVSPEFSHIFAGGYAAGYYSYKWAEVLDADAFSKFLADGIFNKDTARSFRTNILERGGTEDPSVLYARFRGQAPTIDALLRRDGIIPA